MIYDRFSLKGKKYIGREKNMKLTQWILLLISCLHFGCSTILHTSRQKVYVDSNPREAKVSSYNLPKEETTPAYLNLKKGGDIYLNLSKEGYYDDAVQLEKNIVPSVLLNLLLFQFAPVGLFIDWETGAMWDYQDRVYVKLVNKQGQDSPLAIDETEKAPPPSRSSLAPSRRTGILERSFSGPRLGFTYLSGGLRDAMNRELHVDLRSLITQFGWQIEKGIHVSEEGPSVVVALVPLVGGLDQDITLPTVSGLIGLRTEKGLEFALGPIWSKNESAVMYVGGTTVKYGQLNVPFNLALVPFQDGTSVSLLTGFNW
jgi:hypothetical protein